MSIVDYMEVVEKTKRLNKRDLKRLYTSLLPTVREIARQCGYAVGVHGSMTRDMDLIAVPWTDACLRPETLVRRITKKVGGRALPGFGEKPFGRRAYTIVLDGYKSKTHWAVFIDLSITPKL